MRWARVLGAALALTLTSAILAPAAPNLTGGRLRWNALDAIALRHSREMASAGRLYHSSDLAAQMPASVDYAGENVGVAETVEEVADAFWRSPAHRAVLTDARFTRVGVGIVKDGSVWVTVVFARVRSAKPRVPRNAERQQPPGRATAGLHIETDVRWWRFTVILSEAEF